MKSLQLESSKQKAVHLHFRNLQYTSSARKYEFGVAFFVVFAWFTLSTFCIEIPHSERVNVLHITQFWLNSYLICSWLRVSICRMSLQFETWNLIYLSTMGRSLIQIGSIVHPELRDTVHHNQKEAALGVMRSQVTMISIPTSCQVPRPVHWGFCRSGEDVYSCK